MFKKISQNFVESPLKFCLSSDFSPQLMACMLKSVDDRWMTEPTYTISSPIYLKAQVS